MAKEKDKIKIEVKEDKVKISEEIVKPATTGFKCRRCGGLIKISKKGNEVCATCYAPIHWEA